MKGGLPKRPTLTLEQKEPSINKYSVEEQTIMRQSTIDQLELQRRDEILSEIEVRKAGYCAKAVNALWSFLIYKFTTAWTDDAYKIGITRKISVTCKFFKCFTI